MGGGAEGKVRFQLRFGVADAVLIEEDLCRSGHGEVVVSEGVGCQGSLILDAFNANRAKNRSHDGPTFSFTATQAYSASPILHL